MVEKVRLAVTGKRGGSLSKVRLGVLGLTFKAGTDDLRDSPALAVAALLRQAGAKLMAYDPAHPLRRHPHQTWTASPSSTTPTARRKASRHWWC